MPVTKHDLQSLLDDAQDAATAAALTLRESLRNAEKAVRALVNGGSIQSVNKNAAGQTYATSAIGALTTVEVARAWRELITLHDNAHTILVTAGTPAPTDPEIYAEMMARLVPQYANRPDLTNLRCN